MDPPPSPLTFFLLLFTGWINRHQQAVIEYLLEENRVLGAVNGWGRLRLTDDQRRRLAVKGRVLGRRLSVAISRTRARICCSIGGRPSRRERRVQRPRSRAGLGRSSDR
jgi:hypothetical protein